MTIIPAVDPFCTTLPSPALSHSPPIKSLSSTLYVCCSLLNWGEFPTNVRLLCKQHTDRFSADVEKIINCGINNLHFNILFTRVRFLK